MNALRLPAILLVVVLCGFAHPERYQPMTSASFDYVSVLLSGACMDGGVAGVKPGTCWQTEAPWTLQSVSGHLPPKRGVHTSATNANTIVQLRSLIETVGLPAVRAEMAGALALGYHADPALEHVVWASFVLRASGARRAPMAAYPGLEMRVVIPALDPADDPLEQIVSVPGPYLVSVQAGIDADGGPTFEDQYATGTLPIAAVAAAQVLVDGFVIPSVKTENGLPP